MLVEEAVRDTKLCWDRKDILPVVYNMMTNGVYYGKLKRNKLATEKQRSQKIIM